MAKGDRPEDDKVSAGQLKEAAQKTLRVLNDDGLDDGESAEGTAVVALWPEPVRGLSEEERDARLRLGTDTVLYDDPETKTTRGFVRAVLRIPLGDDDGNVYGVFVEVKKDAYLALKKGHKEKTPVRVWGTLATRLPLLEDAYGCPVEILEDGSTLRARVVDADSELLRNGPEVGPEVVASD